MPSRTARAAFAAVTFATCAVAAVGADVVILKDGFVVQGHGQKEVTTVVDKATGKPIPIVKNNGFDMIDEGPKFTIFSVHARQLGGVGPATNHPPHKKGDTKPVPRVK
jgi:hypothetical protein